MQNVCWLPNMYLLIVLNPWNECLTWGWMTWIVKSGCQLEICFVNQVQTERDTGVESALTVLRLLCVVLLYWRELLHVFIADSYAFVFVHRLQEWVEAYTDRRAHHSDARGHLQNDIHVHGVEHWQFSSTTEYFHAYWTSVCPSIQFEALLITTKISVHPLSLGSFY